MPGVMRAAWLRDKLFCAATCDLCRLSRGGGEGTLPAMKNITVSVDDELYRDARAEAARRRKSLSALVREYLAGLRQGSAKPTSKKKKKIDPELEKLWALADSKPARPGSVGPLNREELYQRGVPGY